MDICTFWYGGALRIVDRICLASMVMVAQEHNIKLKLYSYDKITNPVDGVELCDANEIFPKDFIYRLDPNFSISSGAVINSITLAQFSDFFRIKLMEKSKGFWLDTDTYLHKMPKIDANNIWLAKENRYRVGVSAMYIPANNPIIDEFNNYINNDQLIPSWAGIKRKFLRPLLLRAQGKPVLTQYVGITLFGNDGISRLAKKYNLFFQAKKKNIFYYWTARESEKIYDPNYGLEPLEDPDFCGFHIHRKKFSDFIPKDGSFYYWAVKRVVKYYNLSFYYFFDK